MKGNPLSTASMIKQQHVVFAPSFLQVVQVTCGVKQAIRYQSSV